MSQHDVTAHQEPGGYLTYQQAAQELGIGVSTVRRWVAEGELKAVRFGERVIRIHRHDLHAMSEIAYPKTWQHMEDRRKLFGKERA